MMDSKMDVDVGKLPEPHRLSPVSEPASIPTLDGWIESLMSCKQLAENDVQRLCDRVSLRLWRRGGGISKKVEANLGLLNRLGKYCKTNRTCSLWYGFQCVLIEPISDAY